MKPHVICHMAASIDGRTVLDRWRPKGAVAEGLFERVYDELDVDAWLVGRTTGQEFAKGESYPAQSQERVPREAWFARRDAKSYGIVLDPHGRLAWGRSEVQGDHIVAVLTEKVPDAHLAGLRADGVSYFFAGRTSLDLAEVLGTVARELGVERLLLQGGGVTNGAFLHAGLVDEISLVLFPAVDGANGSPSIFEAGGTGHAPAPPVRSITLESHRVLDRGAVWLRYAVR
ncbi:MAG: 2-hydroxy-3-oxopropionate reductase [Leptolyngbya sp. PLA3]|nr:MAG: 2-hydroxy-3-oxopropionate reductase [Cyanobacteria bacterium CYA]MCE7970012.1 2-hydroxy-3-oxopropionate reductase [Leptolyngbya sp. PL-A3]